MESWVSIPGFGFLDSWVWIPGFGSLGWDSWLGFRFLCLDSWVGIPSFNSLVGSHGFLSLGLLGLESCAWIRGLGVLGLVLDSRIWIPGLSLLSIARSD